MLSRRNSDTETRLRRARSSASVNRRRSIHSISESIDPETSQQHALVAAQIAMERAHGRASTEMGRPHSLSRADSHASRCSARNTPRGAGVRLAETSELHRQRSVLQNKSADSAPPYNLAPARSSQYPSAISITHSANEYALPEQYGAQPSSYRKLRKARSMFTPGSRAFGHQPFTPRSIASRMSLHSESRFDSESHGSLKNGLRRSVSFLRNSGGSISRTFKKDYFQGNNDKEVVQMARSQYAREQGYQRSEQPLSSSFSRRAKRPQKALRKTVRSSRTTDFGDAVSSPLQLSAEPDSFGSKTRSFSHGLRQKISKLFGRSAHGNEQFPVQHFEASRPHFGDYAASGNVPSQSDDPYSFEDISADRNNLEDTLPDMSSQDGILRSMRSADDLIDPRSRVTSWTNSTAGQSTVADRSPVERKRLSVIQENGGPHQPSSSAGMHKDGIGLFQNPLRTRTDSGRVHAPIDSQRVYSALLKRLDRVESLSPDRNAPKDASEPVRKILNLENANGIRASQTIRAVPMSGSHRAVSTECDPQEQGGEKPSSNKYAFNSDSAASSPQHVAEDDCIARSQRCTSISNKTKSDHVTLPEHALIAQKEQACSDEDTSSVIISRRHPEESITSASIYSRTTSGDTPILAATQSSAEGEIKNNGARLVSRGRWPADPASLTTDASWTASNNIPNTLDRHIFDLQRQNPARHHIRESAQIGGDDDEASIASRLARIPAGGRRLFDSTTPTKSKPRIHQPAATNDHLQRFELREVSPNNSHTEPRQSPERFIPARQNWNKLRLNLKPIGNDENKRLDGSASRLRLKVSQRSSEPVRGEEETSSSSCSSHRQSYETESDRASRYAKLRVHQTPTHERMLRDRSPVAVQRQTEPCEGNESGFAGEKGLQNTSRKFSGSPFDHDGSHASTTSEARSSGPERPYYADDEGSVNGKENEEVHGLGTEAKFWNSKRLVSNFLRSRRNEREREVSAASAASGGTGAFL
ncbi:MAG: hypothetical protein Q9227_006367 [Pyrenula ochraceoflavens]